MTKNETAAALCIAFAASACSPATNASGGNEGGALAGDATLGGGGDAGLPEAPPVLTGIAATPRFTAKPARMVAALYRLFPFGTEKPLASQAIGGDGTWLFGGFLDAGADAGLDPWAHYFVQIEADFDVDGGPMGSAVSAIVGPLSVPSSGPIAVNVSPIELSVLESRLSGGPMLLQCVLAHVFDPATGNEIKGTATVTVTVGGTPVSVPWSSADGGVAAYSLQFAQPPPAEPTYTVTVASPEFGQAPATFQLVAAEPAFDGAIVSPDGGAPVPAGQPLPVVWTAQPQADYEIVQIFTSSTLAVEFVSPEPAAPDVVEETVEAGLPPGSYLLDVSYSKTNCPATADGCVQANTVAAVNLTAN